MSPEIMETIGHWLMGAGGLGILGWFGRRLVSKLDRVDLLLRGDGNGNRSLAQNLRDELTPQIQAVHQEVRDLHPRLERVEALARDAKQHVIDHDEEANMWKRRIEATEARCEAYHRKGALSGSKVQDQGVHPDRHPHESL